MSKITTISGTVTQTVSLGSNGIQETLTLTGTGVVLPAPVAGMASTYGAVGVEVRAHLAHASITNDGMISGGQGGLSGGAVYHNGGIGIDAAGIYTSLVNSGSIVGGAGAYVATYGEIQSLNGGVGIDLTGADFLVLNRGTVTGGKGGSTFSQHPGAGGTGVNCAASGSFTNTGLIAGGAGGDCQQYSPISGGAGGAGIDLSSASLIVNNSGLILGGAGGLGGYEGPGYSGPRGAWGDGAEVTNGAILINTGGIGGGIGVEASISGTISNLGTIFSTYGGVGVDLQSGGALRNYGNVSGGREPERFGYKPLNGPDGVDMAKGASLSNDGTITGGTGGISFSYKDYEYFGNGGAGVDAGASPGILNQGLILGGQSYQGGGRGGDGVLLTAGAVLNNLGTIEGAAGADGGGSGVDADRATITNGGHLIAGNTLFDPYSDANGAAGLSVTDCNTTNTGLIQGAAYSFASAYGVNISGGTLTTSGTISGGLYDRTLDDAVKAVNHATIALEAGATFNGLVVAYDRSDVLDLTGTTPGLVGGIGSEFVGFASLAESAGANWTLDQDNNLGTTTLLTDAGILTVTGSLIGQDSAKITGGALSATEGGTILLAGVVLEGGTLAGSTTGSVAIGNDAAGLSGGLITVEVGAAISGFGHITGTEIVDDGTIISRAGGLIVAVPVTGTGALDIANGSSLLTGGSVSVPIVTFNAGTNETFYVGRPAELASTIAGFDTGDKVDLAGIVATTLTFLAGTLTLYDNSTVVDTLHFSGDEIASDFMLAPDGQGGTNILYGGAPWEDILHVNKPMADNFSLDWDVWRESHQVQSG